MLEDIFFSAGPVDVNVVIMSVSVIIGFVLSMFIAWVYKRTHRGLSYSPSFVASLVMMGPILSVIMMIVGTSVARAFTVFGAFTLIRFRTAIKDTRDIAFVLWILMAGLGVGTQNHIIAIVSTLLIGVVVWWLSISRFGMVTRFDYVVTLVTAEQTSMFKEVFDRFAKNVSVLSSTTQKDRNRSEMSVQITLKDDVQLNAMIAALKKEETIQEVIVNRTQGDLEF
tara:strand:+ start:134 stop:808 length:675 start_codon:yes stop_codon:yes gene_type:complete